MSTVLGEYTHSGHFHWLASRTLLLVTQSHSQRIWLLMNHSTKQQKRLLGEHAYCTSNDWQSWGPPDFQCSGLLRAHQPSKWMWTFLLLYFQWTYILLLQGSHQPLTECIWTRMSSISTQNKFFVGLNSCRNNNNQLDNTSWRNV